jgi:hypothetical protein
MASPPDKPNWGGWNRVFWRVVLLVVVFAVFASGAFFGDLLCEALGIFNLSSECKESWLWLWNYAV